MMIKAIKSKCNCGECGAKFLVEWNMPFLNVSKGTIGNKIEYLNKGDWECPHCANLICGTLHVFASPVGVLEDSEVKDIHDSNNTGKSVIEKPVLESF